MEKIKKEQTSFQNLIDLGLGNTEYVIPLVCNVSLKEVKHTVWVKSVNNIVGIPDSELIYFDKSCTCCNQFQGESKTKRYSNIIEDKMLLIDFKKLIQSK